MQGHWWERQRKWEGGSSSGQARHVKEGDSCELPPRTGGLQPYKEEVFPWNQTSFSNSVNSVAVALGMGKDGRGPRSPLSRTCTHCPVKQASTIDIIVSILQIGKLRLKQAYSASK